MLNILISRFLPLISNLFSRHPLNRPVRASILAVLLQRVEIIANFCIYSILHFRYKRGALLGMKESVNSKAHCGALVLANGPSLSKLNLDMLLDYKGGNDLEVFAINFALVDGGIPPELITYLVLSDEGTMPVSKLPQSISLWKILEHHTEIRLITPDSWHSRFPELRCLESSCLHFNDNSLEGMGNNTNPLRARCYSSMTAYKAMAVADFFGYKRKLVLGLDNSWYLGLSVDKDNRLHQASVHFKTDYFRDQDISEQFKGGTAEYFFEVYHAFKSIHENFKGMQFLNMDQNSLIDTFPKIREEDPEFRLLS